MPCVVTLLNWAPIFEWSMARFVPNNRHQKVTYYNEIGLCVQNFDTTLGLIVNTIERAYVNVKETSL